MLKIAIQKSGRLYEESVKLLKECGIQINNGNKQLKLQILKSKNGNLYSKVDTWKPDVQAVPVSAPIVLPEIDSLPF